MPAEKKKKEEEVEAGAPAWMATFGDLMSLLLTFFVLIVSFSSVQESKFKNAIWSLRGAFQLFKTKGIEAVQGGDKGMYIYSRPNEMKQDEARKEGNKEQRQEQILSQFSAEMRKLTRKTMFAKHVKIKSVKKGIKIMISDKVLFKPGGVKLKPESYSLLNTIVRLLKPLPFKVQIEGHTDNQPIHTEDFPSNWELSAERAMNVLKFFIRTKFPGNRLSAIAYGEYSPVSLNDTREGRSRNRRVEILILKKELK